MAPLIIGAGFTGLLAAHVWPTAQVLEIAPAPAQRHKALMRFRTDAVSHLMGIEFRKVIVRKGIYYQDRFVTPTIETANLYARKVVGRIVDRSIWNLKPVIRYVAPENFYDQLIDAVKSRIHFGQPYFPAQMAIESSVINTAPLPMILTHHPIRPELSDQVQCRKLGIRVRRWRVPHADVFQTVYFPSPGTPVYRMSITKDLLIVEEVHNTIGEIWAGDREVTSLIQHAFGVEMDALEFLDDTEQSYRKVDELSATLRKQVLLELTARYQVFSLGRFATWRNVLLDDVIQDINVIKRLMKTGTMYDAHKVAAQSIG